MLEEGDAFPVFEAFYKVILQSIVYKSYIIGLGKSIDVFSYLLFCIMYNVYSA